MLLYDQHPHNKSIMAGLIGVPNAGKSTLINTLLGFDLAAVTHKAQTTRNKYQCAFTIDRTEIVLVDTPGLHKSSKEINKRMNGQAIEGNGHVDLNLMLIDLSQDLFAQFQVIRQTYEGELGKTWIVFTKSDLVDKADELNLEGVVEKVKELFTTAEIEQTFIISSKKDSNIHLLTGALCDEAQPGPHLYPDGSVSNKNERFFATEYIREQAFEALNDELPYEMAVVIDSYSDNRREDKKQKGADSHISASILVNRPSQRAIVVGSKGSVIKKIGMGAREKIENMTGNKVFLNLHVKVAPKWFQNNYILEELGLPRVKNSARVWRQK